MLGKTLPDLKKLKLISVLPSMTQTELNNIWITYPPLNVQNDIVNYLNDKCQDIDNLIALKQSKIKELDEYMKSLVFEYVTGKKEIEV